MEVIFQKIEVALLGLLGIWGVFVALARWKKYPRASRFVFFAGLLLLVRTVGLGIFAMITRHLYHSQSEAVAGLLVALAFAVLFSAAFAFPNDERKSRETLNRGGE